MQFLGPARHIVKTGHFPSFLHALISLRTFLLILKCTFIILGQVTYFGKLGEMKLEFTLFNDMLAFALNDGGTWKLKGKILITDFQPVGKWLLFIFLGLFAVFCCFLYILCMFLKYNFSLNFLFADMPIDRERGLFNLHIQGKNDRFIMQFQNEAEKTEWIKHFKEWMEVS